MGMKGHSWTENIRKLKALYGTFLDRKHLTTPSSLCTRCLYLINLLPDLFMNHNWYGILYTLDFVAAFPDRKRHKGVNDRMFQHVSTCFNHAP